MLKKTYKRIFLALLLLLMMTVSVGFLTTAQAQTSDSYSLVIHYNSDHCETIKLSIPGQQTVDMISGSTYYIPKNNAAITIKVVFKAGYEKASMSGGNGDYGLNAQNEYSATVTSNDEVTLTCRPKTYRIEYEYASEGTHQNPHGGSFPETFTYGEETRVSIPTLDGYKFKSWMIVSDSDATTGTLLVPTGNNDYVTISGDTLPNSADGKLHLKPVWEAKHYAVTRYDCVYDPNKPDHIGTTLEGGVVDLADSYPMNSVITGDMGGAKHYPGFYYVATEEYYTSTGVTVRDETNWNQVNIVYRLYLPITYTLEYVSGYDGAITFPDGATVPEYHVFNKATEIPAPIRVGYEFIGWTVTVTVNGTEGSVANTSGQIAMNDPLYAGDKDTKLVFRANWKSLEYDVQIDLNTGNPGEDISIYPEKYVYESGLQVQAPVRIGYTFDGWLINGGTEVKTGDLPAATYFDTVTLVAQWTPNEYNVTLDGNGGTLTSGTESMKVTFDSAPNTDALKAALPTREGHRFLGFTLLDDATLIIDAEGNFLPAAWTIAADTTLYAKWEVLSYQVTVNVTNAEAWLNGILYEGTPITFPYGTEITVVIRADDTYKVVSFEGAAVVHAHEYTTLFTLLAEDAVLDASVVRMVQTPAFYVDYPNEIFTVANGIPNGDYRISCGSEALHVLVQNGEIYVNDVKVTHVVIPESFWGETVSIVTYGDGVTGADSDATTLTPAARPEPPVMPTHIDSIYADNTSIALKINLNSPFTYLYEFALFLDEEGTQQVYGWTAADALATGKEGEVMFRNLNPGTYYYLYVRVKASQTYPHGDATFFAKNTYYEDYFNDKLTELREMIANDADGSLAKELVERAIADIEALTKPSATFYHELEGIYNSAVSALPFARSRDEKIAQLKALLSSLVETGRFNQAGELELTSLCQTAVASIRLALTDEEARLLYTDAEQQMRAVKISYLYASDGTFRLFSEKGLPQGVALLLSRIEEYATLRDSVDQAIALGNVSVNGTQMSLAEAIEALRSMDVMSYYTMSLVRDGGVYTTFDGKYEFRLLLPEDLRGVTGLRVAYYDTKTGVLELLDTTRDGNYLIFEADRAGSFVILGDPTMNLTAFIAALSVVLLCQLIGIVLLILRRTRYKKQTRHYVSVLPVALAIRFLPENALNIVLILAGLVVLFQIILMYLLLSSDMFFRRKRRQEPVAPVVVDEPMVGEASSEESVQDTFPEEPDAFAVAMTASVMEESELEEAELSELDSDALFDDEAVAEEQTEEQELEEEEYGESFIEPAANPQYSLPEEAFADYDDEEAEPADVEETEEVEAEGDAENEAIDSFATEWVFDDSDAEQLSIEDEPAQETLETDSEELSEEEDAFADEDADLPKEDSEEVFEPELTSEETEMEFEDEDSEEELRAGELREDDAMGDPCPEEDELADDATGIPAYDESSEDDTRA